MKITIKAAMSKEEFLALPKSEQTKRAKTNKRLARFLEQKVGKPNTEKNTSNKFKTVIKKKPSTYSSNGKYDPEKLKKDPGIKSLSKTLESLGLDLDTNHLDDDYGQIRIDMSEDTETYKEQLKVLSDKFLRQIKKSSDVIKGVEVEDNVVYFDLKSPKSNLDRKKEKKENEAAERAKKIKYEGDYTEQTSKDVGELLKNSNFGELKNYKNLPKEIQTKVVDSFFEDIKKGKLNTDEVSRFTQWSTFLGDKDKAILSKELKKIRDIRGGIYEKERQIWDSDKSSEEKEKLNKKLFVDTQNEIDNILRNIKR